MNKENQLFCDPVMKMNLFNIIICISIIIVILALINCIANIFINKCIKNTVSCLIDQFPGSMYTILL